MNHQPPTSQLPPIASIPSIKPHPRWIIAVIISSAGIALGVIGTHLYQRYAPTPVVSSYIECIKAPGSSLQESYPATCITHDGKRFIQPIQHEGINPTNRDILSCNTDSDCTIGIQPGGCCTCPKPINSTEIGKDGWVDYDNYMKESHPNTCETFVACKPCADPTVAVCRKSICTFSNTQAIPPQSNTGYVCPENEWVDCMPGPDSAGIRFECTQEYLSWAKETCPNFKGAAL